MQAPGIGWLATMESCCRRVIQAISTKHRACNTTHGGGGGGQMDTYIAVRLLARNRAGATEWLAVGRAAGATSTRWPRRKNKTNIHRSKRYVSSGNTSTWRSSTPIYKSEERLHTKDTYSEAYGRERNIGLTRRTKLEGKPEPSLPVEEPPPVITRTDRSVKNQKHPARQI